MSIGVLQKELTELVKRGDVKGFILLSNQLWKISPNLNSAAFILSEYKKLNPKEQFITKRIAFLRSFTIEPVVTLFRAAALVNGINLDVYVGGLNTYSQEILDPESNLYRFDPEITIMAVQLGDIAPELLSNFADLGKDQIENIHKRVVGNFSNLLDSFRSRSRCDIIVHSFENVSRPNNGILDYQLDRGQIFSIRRLNLELLEVLKKYSGVHFLDYEALTAEHGIKFWFDEVKALTMRMPIAANAMIYLAEEWLRFIHPIIGKTKKVLVVDLDNTLWGGVIGEDGINGIRLDIEYPSAGYLKLQRAILDLYRRGIILAVCSKNNIDDVKVAFGHSRMLLKLDHFSSVRINWNDKARNLTEIASELNVGMDSMVFLDDNPVERQFVRGRLPEVLVLDMPENIMDYAAVLYNVFAFERLSLSKEDAERGLQYLNQQKRSELKKDKTTLDDFYRSLSLEVDIFFPKDESITRISQLTQKTNQFNLTTRRYTEPQISQMLHSSDYTIYAMRVRDCFGDHGLVGLAIVHNISEISEIDTFLLSCRVIGLEVEKTLLAVISNRARQEGRKKLVGCFIPSSKNTVVKDFYCLNGFKCVAETLEETQWELDLGSQQVSTPKHISLNLI